jgi:hypothetical protein
LNKWYKEQDELFHALKHNKEEIISIKKAIIKESDCIPYNFSVTQNGETVKSLNPSKTIGYGDYVFPVINTTNYLDSHDDVHIPGLWGKSVKEQTGKVYHVASHKLEIGYIISWPKDVTPMIKSITWDELGASYSGETEALIFKSKLTERSNRDAFLAYKENDPIQHSIRMRYHKVAFAVNSKDESFKEEKANWDKFYPQIVNKEKADKQGYFFAVIEAEIYKEGSAVIEGSNNVTPTMYDLKGAVLDTSSEQPSNDTVKAIDYGYLADNFKLKL